MLKGEEGGGLALQLVSELTNCYKMGTVKYISVLHGCLTAEYMEEWPKWCIGAGQKSPG